MLLVAAIIALATVAVIATVLGRPHQQAWAHHHLGSPLFDAPPAADAAHAFNPYHWPDERDAAFPRVLDDVWADGGDR